MSGRLRRRPLTPAETVALVLVFVVSTAATALQDIIQETPLLFLVIFGCVFVFGIVLLVTLWPRSNTARRHPVLDAMPEALPESLDLAGVRIAMSGRALADVRAAIPDTRGPATVNQVRSVVSTLLALQDSWVFTSLESTPRRPLAQLAQAASRLMDDAIKRFPVPSSGEPGTPDAFRSPTTRGDSVFVVSLVFTSRENITDHQGESHEQTRELLTEMSTLAARVHTLDVFVSGVLSVDELAQRDPAMRGIA